MTTQRIAVISKPITTREIDGLMDIHTRKGRYRWKPTTMHRLQDRGYVRFIGFDGREAVFEITDAGVAFAKYLMEEVR